MISNGRKMETNKKEKLLVSVEAGHVVIEDESETVVFDIPCKSTPDATMLVSSLVNHSINMNYKPGC